MTSAFDHTPSAPSGTPSGLAPTPLSDNTAMIIDTHTQLWQSLEQLGPQTAQKLRQSPQQPWERPDTSDAGFDQAMKTVQYAIVLGFESRHLRASIPAQQIADYVARQPGKYLGFAGIDPMAPGYLNEVKKAKDLGLVGINLSPAAGAFHPCNSRAMRLYERCQELGLPIMIHPGTHFGIDTVMAYSQPYLLDEPAREFPRLRVVLAGIGAPWVEQTLALLEKHEHFYADVSDLTGRPWQLYNALLLAYQRGVMDRLLFGSDYPFCTPQQAILNIYSVNAVTQGTHMPAVPREQLRSVIERDALACLGIQRPAQTENSSKGNDPDASEPTIVIPSSTINADNGASSTKGPGV